MTLSLPKETKINADKALCFILIGVILTLMISSLVVPIMAANAYADIINDARFEGDIRQIEWIVTALDKGIVWIISFVGFFIISAAMLRNVLAGAYCAYPTLFDKIEHTQKQWRARGGSGGPGGGTLLYFISFVIPNIKPLTDFADGTASPQGYFTKALLLGVVTVIIGVTIYNGLYRDLIREGAGLGTHIIGNYILKIDFVSEFDKILESGRMYDFVWSNSQNAADKQRQQVARKLYMEVLRAYPDARSSDTRAAIGRHIESLLLGWFPQEADQYFGNENYKFAYDIKWLETAGEAPIAPTAPSRDADRDIFAAWTMEQLGMGEAEPLHQAQHWVRCLLRFTMVNVSAKDGTFSNVYDLYMPKLSGTTDTAGKTIFSIPDPTAGTTVFSTSSPAYFVRNNSGSQDVISVTFNRGQLTVVGFYKNVTESNGKYSVGGDSTTPYPKHSSLIGTWRWIETTGSSASYLNYGKGVVETITFSESVTESIKLSKGGSSVDYGGNIELDGADLGSGDTGSNTGEETIG